MKKDKAYIKTEKLLYTYPAIKQALDHKDCNNTILGEKVIRMVDDALDQIKDDVYSDIIQRIYFDRETMESVAFDYNVSSPTISANRRRLIDRIKVYLYTDDVIDELLPKKEC